MSLVTCHLSFSVEAPRAETLQVKHFQEKEGYLLSVIQESREAEGGVRIALADKTARRIEAPAEGHARYRFDSDDGSLTGKIGEVTLARAFPPGAWFWMDSRGSAGVFQTEGQSILAVFFESEFETDDSVRLTALNEPPRLPARLFAMLVSVAEANAPEQRSAEPPKEEEPAPEPQPAAPGNAGRFIEDYPMQQAGRTLLGVLAPDASALKRHSKPDPANLMMVFGVIDSIDRRDGVTFMFLGKLPPIGAGWGKQFELISMNKSVFSLNQLNDRQLASLRRNGVSALIDVTDAKKPLVLEMFFPQQAAYPQSR